jgi:tetratricopeptide (TPR) repeat protein
VTNHELDEKLAQAKEALSRADFPAAIALLEELVVEPAAAGGNAEAWRQLGVCYLETQRPDMALEALTRAVRAAPEDATAHYLLGNACGTLGQLERAAACYRRALEIDPHHAKAEEFLMKAESLLESREHYRTGLSLLYSSQPTPQDFNRALRELAQSVAIFDGSPARDNLLECARQLLALLREWPIPMKITSELEPWAAACERGYHCVQFKNWLGAQAAYQEALSYRAPDAFVQSALAFCLVELGETDEAVRAWLRTLELDPNYDFTRLGHVQRIQ